jgi:TetR/AcrR family transcriptional repressor of nem operon
MESVLQRALDVFWEHGFAATTIPEISKATGLLPGSLYAAFDDKDKMFRLALERYARWLVAQLPSNLKGLDGIGAALDTIVRLTVEDPKRRGCPMLNAIPEVDALSPETQRLLKGGHRWMRSYFRDRLLETPQQARVTADLEQLEALLFAAAVAIRVLGRAGLEPRLLQQIADAALAATRANFKAPTVPRHKRASKEP